MCLPSLAGTLPDRVVALVFHLHFEILFKARGNPHAFFSLSHSSLQLSSVHFIQRRIHPSSPQLREFLDVDIVSWTTSTELLCDSMNEPQPTAVVIATAWQGWSVGLGVIKMHMIACFHVSEPCRLPCDLKFRPGAIRQVNRNAFLVGHTCSRIIPPILHCVKVGAHKNGDEPIC